MPDGSPVTIGTANTGTQYTLLARSGGNPTEAFIVTNSNGIAIAASTDDSSIAVDASSEFGNGVRGYSREAMGVIGLSDGWNGVFGETADDSSAGVFGRALMGGAGVWGQVGGPGGWPGVEGYSSTGNGVRGVSIAPAAPSSVGVVGYSTNGIGVVGISGSPSSFGGYFIGGLTVVGGPKSAAVPHPDGSHRLLYSMESPESWFEDFGRGKLVRGKAKVKLEAAFAAVVRTDDYHVFLSPDGETNGLYVSGRNRSAFEVREHRRGTSNVVFSYRVVARRRDIKAPRLPKIVLPSYDAKDLVRMPRAVKLFKITKARKEHRPVRRAT